MKFISKHIGLFRGLTSILTVLVIFTSVAQYYATGLYRAKVDELLGTNSGAIEHSADISDYKYPSDYDRVEDLMEAQKVLNERIMEEGAVLLKGSVDDVVVEGNKNVTLFGVRSFKMQYNSAIGGVSNNSLVVRLDSALEERGFKVNKTMVDFYKSMLASHNLTATDAVNEVSQSKYTDEQVNSYKDYSDAAIVVLGRVCSEAYTFLPGSAGIKNPDEFSKSSTGNILGLSDDEKDLIAHIEQQGFSKIIVLINSSSTMEIEELKQNENIDAIMLIGNPGCYGNYGIADILSGEAIPSGHLPDTYAVNTAVAPAAMNFGEFAYANNEDVYSAWYLAEEEGIYVGYKYYETRFYDAVMNYGKASVAAHNETADGGQVWDYDKEVSYAFGYGVEGSKFQEEIVDMNIDWTGKTDSTVTVKVTNIGDRAAKHVVQLYVSIPYTDYDKQSGLEKSAIQLVAYGKTGEANEKGFADVFLLGVGESEEVVLTFNAKDFSSYDVNYAHDNTKGAYVLEQGTYYFATGNGAHDAVCAVIKEQNNSLLSNVEVTGTVKTQDLSELMAFTVGADGVALIENQLEDMDFTYEAYGDAFTSKGAQYLTRSDWADTFPQPVIGVVANDYMLVPLNNGTYDKEQANEEYAGPVYTDEDFGVTDQLAEYTVRDIIGLTDYDDPMFEKVLSGIPREDYSNYAAGNNCAVEEILLEHGNAADSPHGIIYGYGMYNDTRPPFTVEAGDGSMRGVAPAVYIGSSVLAATFSHKLAEAEGNLIGNDALWVGAYWWFGPGMNLHRSPYNARNNEYYSEDAILTGCMAVDVTNAVQEKGIVVCAKHFAFNDQELNRTGVGAFMSEQAARENELRSFEFAFVKGGMKSVMTGFNRVGCTFSSAHYGLMTNICRSEWGHKGLIITDSVKDRNYMRAAESLLAGTDFMLGGAGKTIEAWENISADVVKDDAVLTNALRVSLHRYLYTFADTALFDGYPEDASISEATWWDVGLTTARNVLWIVTILLAVLWGVAYVSNRKERHNG